MNRKDPRNFGTELSNAQPPETPYRTAAGRYAVAMPERVIVALLRDTIEQLLASEDLLRQFFSHLFGPMIGADELESYVVNFRAKPPTTVLGYPRTGAEFPCMAVILEREEEGDEALGQYLGETLPGEPDIDAREFLGTAFTCSYGIYVFAEHPDVCLYNYHLAKGVLIGANQVLHELGLIDPHFSGGDLQPQPEYLPENMFVRRLEVSAKALFTVPQFLTPDPARVRVAGIFAHDIVVSGMRGGVKVEGEDGC